MLSPDYSACGAPAASLSFAKAPALGSNAVFRAAAQPDFWLVHADDAHRKRQMIYIFRVKSKRKKCARAKPFLAIAGFFLSRVMAKC
jgi:hypothetical protein